MKLKLIPVLIVLSATAFVSCKEDTTAQSDPPPENEDGQSGYPIDTCVVSGEKLGSMGKPFVITHEGTEVRFCCDACLPDFEKDPAKYLAKLKK